MMYGRVVLEDKEFLIRKLKDIENYSLRLIENVDRGEIEIPSCIVNPDIYKDKVKHGLKVISQFAKIITYKIETSSYTDTFWKEFIELLNDLNKFVFELYENYIVDERLKKGLYSIIMYVNDIMSYIIVNIDKKCNCKI